MKKSDVCWQHKRPTKRGYYWFRYDDGADAEAEIVAFYPGRGKGLFDGPHYYPMNSDIPYTPKPCNWWWPVAVEAPSVQPVSYRRARRKACQSPST